MKEPGTTNTAYQLVHGIDRTLESGSSFIARYSIVTLIHGFMRAGDPAKADPLKLPPRVEMLGPTAVTNLDDPRDIWITWNSAWQRWDGQAYSRTQSAPLPDTEADIEYRLIYSADNGQTWRHCKNRTLATPGVRATNPVLYLDDLVTNGGGGAFAPTGTRAARTSSEWSATARTRHSTCPTTKKRSSSIGEHHAS